jgi:hypothetical protein
LSPGAGAAVHTESATPEACDSEAKQKAGSKMNRHQREEIAQTLLSDVAADPELKPGDLPWRLSEEQWMVFKMDPERFRKQAPQLVAELACSECGNIYAREELMFESEHVHYCRSCLQIL